MKRFKNILLPVEDFAAAGNVLKRATALAQTNGARLTVAYTIPALPPELRRLSLAIDASGLTQLATEERMAALREMVEPLWAAGIDVRSKVLWGSPFLEVTREVLRESHDLVMIAAEDTSEFGQAIFGSTPMHLMRKCPCPVWALSPRYEPKPYTNVLAAVDVMAASESERGLNSKIMELATSLARMEGSQLHVIHAWRPWTSVAFPFQIEGCRRHSEEIMDESESEQRRREFADFLTTFNFEGLQLHTHFVQGDPGEVIPQVASTQRAGIIVMGTVCRTGVSGFFIGNTAETVLMRVNCSVLTVKPEGFVTPVKLQGEEQKTSSAVAL